MAKPASLAVGRGSRALYWAEQAAIVVSASLFVALCARVTRAAAVYSGASDLAEFWRAAGGPYAGKPSRLCSLGALPG